MDKKINQAPLITVQEVINRLVLAQNRGIKIIISYSSGPNKRAG